jgi:hypothetical protein
MTFTEFVHPTFHSVKVVRNVGTFDFGVAETVVTEGGGAGHDSKKAFSTIVAHKFASFSSSNLKSSDLPEQSDVQGHIVEMPHTLQPDVCRLNMCS